MHKAIVITPENRKMLNDRFSPDPMDEVSITPGYILVAPFDSQDVLYEVLNVANFKAAYHITGKKLQNGFFEVRKK